MDDHDLDAAGEPSHAAQPGAESRPDRPDAEYAQSAQASAADADADDASAGGWDGLPRCIPEDDFDADAEMARWVADVEAGRERIPEEWELDRSGISLSLGDACDLDPALLAAMIGPDGLGGQSLSPVFGQDEAADTLRPGPVLAARRKCTGESTCAR